MQEVVQAEQAVWFFDFVPSRTSMVTTSDSMIENPFEPAQSSQSSTHQLALLTQVVTMLRSEEFLRFMHNSKHLPSHVFDENID